MVAFVIQMVLTLINENTVVKTRGVQKIRGLNLVWFDGLKLGPSPF